MPSLRHSSAMLSSPRRPSSTMRILSSAEKWRRVYRRMPFTTCSAGAFADDFALQDLGFIFVPSSLRQSQILLTSQPQICAMGANGGQYDVSEDRTHYE